MDPKVTKYLDKYVEVEENKLKVIEAIEKVNVMINIEEELDKINANNSNGIQLMLRSLEKWRKLLNKWLTNAKTNESNVTNEIESIKELISCLMSIILQEKNFESISNMYKDVTGIQFIAESKVYLESDTITDQNQEHQIPFSVRHLEDSFLKRSPNI